MAQVIGLAKSRGTWALAAMALLSAFVLACGVVAAGWPHRGVWLDEVFTLWAGDPRVSFGEAFAHRILPDTNPPLYFSLVYWVRKAFALGPDEAFLLINGLGAAAVLVMIAQRCWGAGAPRLGLCLSALILSSAPVLALLPEGRAYALGMVTTAGLAVLLALAWRRPPTRLDAVLAIVLAALAALLHLFAAWMAGALAAGAVVAGQAMGRRPVRDFGLLVGCAGVAVTAVWMLFAWKQFAAGAGGQFWLTFDRTQVVTSVGMLKRLLFGDTLVAIPAACMLALALIQAPVRRWALWIGVSAVIFFVLPFLISFHSPVFYWRYLAIGLPAFTVLLAFAVADLAADLRWQAGVPQRAIVVSAVAALVAPVVFAPSTVQLYNSLFPNWRGAEIVRAHLADCPAQSVRTVFRIPLDRLFAYMLDRPEIAIEPSRSAPVRDAAEINCAVVLWAEEVNPIRSTLTDPIGELLQAGGVTNVTEIPLEAHRYPGGYVITKQPASNRVTRTASRL